MLRHLRRRGKLFILVVLSILFIASMGLMVYGDTGLKQFGGMLLFCLIIIILALDS